MTHYNSVFLRHFVKPTRLTSALLTTTITIASLLCIPICKAESDLDDNIASYKDDHISKWDSLGKKSVNISFIVVEALGGIKRPDKDKLVNSVVVGPGSNTGDIYNIHINNGNTATKSSNKNKESETNNNSKK